MQKSALSLAVSGLMALSLAGALAAPQHTAHKPKPAHRPTKSGGKLVTTKSGLKYVDLKVGAGPKLEQGQTYLVHYVGTLMNGKKFDSSRDRNEPYPITLGVSHVIQGWQEGLATMRVGGRRKLIIPSPLAYGPGGTPDGAIPPNATIQFDVEVLKKQ